MTRYHPILVALHWLLALFIIMALIAGNVLLEAVPNSDPAKIGGLSNHMTLGITITVLMLVRLALHIFTQKPAHVKTGNGLIDFAGKAAHWALYALVLGMGFSGIAMSQMAGLPDIVFGASGAPLPESFDIYPPRAAHGIISVLLILLIIAHAGAALWHQFLRKDGLLSRMWFGKR